jgi:hypothetical protein
MIRQQYEGVKNLLLDDFTAKVVSMVHSQNQILEKEAYLVNAS